MIAYDRVWRTGANAATQFTTSAPLSIAGIAVPAGTHSLWTIPRATGVELIVNGESGQWGTQYASARDLGTAQLRSESVATPVERFTIAVNPNDTRNCVLTIQWGTFRWTAPIAVR